MGEELTVRYTRREFCATFSSELVRGLFCFPVVRRGKIPKKKGHHARELGKKAVEVPYMAHAGGEAESWRSRERERERREIVSHTGCVWLLYQDLNFIIREYPQGPARGTGERMIGLISSRQCIWLTENSYFS